MQKDIYFFISIFAGLIAVGTAIGHGIYEEYNVSLYENFFASPINILVSFYGSALLAVFFNILSGIERRSIKEKNEKLARSPSIHL
ncbi:hypothetical protein C0584_04425 [Candidatus Parcubacteria bacterium]|nr:MAG: hypothetical protein C0584_04425 [Candidatus Parcubacteria bacterium]